MVKPCSCLKKSVAYHNWFALPERPVSDARAPFVLPEYLKMVLSKSVMRIVARFRIWRHGFKCETGLYGRSPDRSARVCNLCENGDIQVKKWFGCMLDFGFSFRMMFKINRNSPWCLETAPQHFVFLLALSRCKNWTWTERFSRNWAW